MGIAELEISKRDWLIIVTFSFCLGLFVSLMLFLVNTSLQVGSTLLFGVFASAAMAFFSFVLITFSNSKILPHVPSFYWYGISFIFSFLAGSGGFLVAYFVFALLDAPIIGFLSPFLMLICVVLGTMTFLMGLLFHWLSVWKNRHEMANAKMMESKIEALEKELNPHFLFNALNSISELVYQDPKKAEGAIVKLSSFLRNALYVKGVVSVEEEIQMLKDYISLENSRFGGKIYLHLDIDKAFAQHCLPKFSVQLLAENAIKHGIGQAILNIYVIGFENQLIVENDGVKSENIQFKGGLKNLQRRLKLLNLGVLHHDKQAEQTRFVIRLFDENHDCR